MLQEQKQIFSNLDYLQANGRFKNKYAPIKTIFKIWFYHVFSSEWHTKVARDVETLQTTVLYSNNITNICQCSTFSNITLMNKLITGKMILSYTLYLDGTYSTVNHNDLWYNHKNAEEKKIVSKKHHNWQSHIVVPVV